MSKTHLKQELAAIGAKIALGLPLTEYERALWALYGEKEQS